MTSHPRNYGGNYGVPKFAVGNQVRLGTTNPNAGRTPDWLRQYTRNIIEKDKLVERLALIASGGLIEQPLNNGEIIPLPAPVAEQRKAILDLLERGYGKPDQTIDLNVSQSELAAAPTADIRDLVAAFQGGTAGPSGSGAGAKA